MNVFLLSCQSKQEQDLQDSQDSQEKRLPFTHVFLLSCPSCYGISLPFTGVKYQSYNPAHDSQD